MGGLFICYRSEDSHTAPALIDGVLSAWFGSDNVFLDTRCIPAGADYVEELLNWLRVCDVLVVVIGPQWLTPTRGSKRRIDDPQDWVRREIKEAFEIDLRVVPVLLDGVTQPSKNALPADIAKLSRCHHVPLRDRYAVADLDYLAKRLIEDVPNLARAARQRQAGGGSVPLQLSVPPTWSLDFHEALLQVAGGSDQRKAAVLRTLTYGNADMVLNTLKRVRYAQPEHSSGLSRYDWEIFLHFSALNSPATVAKVIPELIQTGWAYEAERVAGTAMQRPAVEALRFAGCITDHSLRTHLFRWFAMHRSTDDVADVILFGGEEFWQQVALFRDPGSLARLMENLKRAPTGKSVIRYFINVCNNRPDVHYLARALEREGLRREAKTVEKNAIMNFRRD